ncbi:Transferrin receptor-like, ESAG6-like [Trypanosoma congolense IL3000]|uniref:Transferrin receptor-like, ESAG6-like n=1 Tax=Trypanosoma congolense (strain IL3000) TaxID=1068625 RepID=F9W4C3_TRYCI|nr:Transferrin receptor-like, ESAG6-like [Trypanosoma congolense IL3000]
MSIKGSSVWWLVASMFMAWLPMVSVGSLYPKAIPTEAGESICTLSWKLKEVTLWASEKVEALRKESDAYASQLLDWQLHFHESLECEVNQSILEEIRTALGTANEELQKLPKKAIRAGALAAKSAGRLDEFITVFANAQKESFMNQVNYCMTGGGRPARRRDLIDCFPTGSRLEIGETNLAKIPESTTSRNEPNLASEIKNITHSSLSKHWYRYALDSGAECNLIKGASSGILGVNLNGPLWWGGVILTIGKSFSGQIEKTAFNAGEIANATKGSESNKSFWTASPSTAIPHLNKTLAAIQDFKDAEAIITRKFSEIEKIEKQIETCLSNETMEEGHTQSCFKNAVKINAELQAANALLERYHKEKGPPFSRSALIHHQSVVNVWYLILATFL